MSAFSLTYNPPGYHIGTIDVALVVTVFFRTLIRLAAFLIWKVLVMLPVQLSFPVIVKEAVPAFLLFL